MVKKARIAPHLNDEHGIFLNGLEVLFEDKVRQIYKVFVWLLFR